MAKLKKGVTYRKLERPYTRYSKYRKKAYVRTVPNLKIVRFDMGNLTKEFEYQIDVIARAGIQIRQESLESARQTANRYLEKYVGKQNFHMKIRVFPFHILRENPLAQGAGADRFSTGMAHSFGKVIGRAAQVKDGQVLISAYTNKESVKQVTVAMKKSTYKIPCRCVLTESQVKKAIN